MSFKQDTNLADALQAMPPTAELILKSRPVKFNDETFEGFQDLLGESMRQVLNTYRGGNGFLNKMKKINPWTFRQTRAIANILMEQLRAQDGKGVNEASTPSGQTPAFAQTAGPKPSANKPVLPAFTPERDINLRTIPAGRFAVHFGGEWRFFIITNLKRRTRLSGRFVWTKHRYANEYLDKGDLTVREQIGDTKKLIGKQRQGDPFYLGEEEEIIEIIQKGPVAAMQDYGREVGRCAYCGRSLTDQDSRDKGIGPDCWVNKHEPFLSGSMVTS